VNDHLEQLNKAGRSIDEEIPDDVQIIPVPYYFHHFKGHQCTFPISQMTDHLGVRTRTAPPPSTTTLQQALVQHKQPQQQVQQPQTAEEQQDQLMHDLASSGAVVDHIQDVLPHPMYDNDNEQCDNNDQQNDVPAQPPTQSHMASPVPTSAQQIKTDYAKHLCCRILMTIFSPSGRIQSLGQ